MPRTRFWCFMLSFLFLSVQSMAQTLRRIGTLPFPKEENRHPRALANTDIVKLNNGKNAVSLYTPEGKLVSDAQYTSIDNLQHGRILVSVSSSRYGYLDAKGQVVVPLDYDGGEPFKFDRAVVRRPDKSFFLIDTSGHATALPGEYEEVQTIEPGLFYAGNREGKYGVIRENGTVVIPFEYGDIRKSSDHDLYIVTRNKWILTGDEKQGLVDGQGKELIPIADQRISVGKTYINVFLNGVGDIYYDTSGQRLADQKFEIPAEGEYRYVYKKKFANLVKYGLLDSNFQPVTTASFEHLSPSIFGFFSFTESGYAKRRTGLLNRKGERIIEQEGYADIKMLSPRDIVIINRKTGIWYNEMGRPMLPDTMLKMPQYFGTGVMDREDTTTFEVLFASLNGNKYGLYNRMGQALTPEQYDSLYYLTRDKVVFTENQKFGLLDARGKVLLPAQFDALRVSRSGTLKYKLIFTTRNGFNGLMTINGRELLPAEYAIGQIEVIDEHHLWARRGKDWEIYEIIW